jgi:transcription-repair coupling factor (superfamily II helicase)
MALMGLRDISALQTAPRERQAIETRVKQFDPETLRHAVRRELNREGQVYLVHNRVHSIDAVAETVRDLVPEARVEVGHGQMPERQLADVMERFTEGEVDVLVSTTIIENGLDIPNANTLIVNRAELLGLAEMHQLRGRVGRYIHKAYAYFFTPPDRPITPEAKERLKAIRRYSQLGAGFDIALRDLELRGAGNILGPQQSGHIAAVGYNLYCRLLERATARLKGEPEAEPPTTTINIGLDVVLPDDYVPDLRQRMELYREISQVTNRGDLQEVARHLRDRFGPPPRPVRNLLLETELRVLAQNAGADSVQLQDGRLRFSIRELEQFRAHFERAGVHVRVRKPDMLGQMEVPDGGDALAVARFLRRVLTPKNEDEMPATPVWAEP